MTLMVNGCPPTAGLLLPVPVQGPVYKLQHSWPPSTRACPMWLVLGDASYLYIKLPPDNHKVIYCQTAVGHVSEGNLVFSCDGEITLKLKPNMVI